MADILDSAQKQIDEAANTAGAPPAGGLPPSSDLPPEPAPEPVTGEKPAPQASEPPKEIPKEDAEAIVETLLAAPGAPVTTPPPPAAAGEPPKEETPAAPPPRKAKSKTAVLAAILLLLVTLPLTVFFVSQQRQLADIRSLARIDEPCRVCQNKTCATIASGVNCNPDKNECSTNANCGAVAATKTPTPAQSGQGDGSRTGATSTPTKAPTKTPTPRPDSCGSGRTCKSYMGGTACLNAGGEIVTCTTGAGTPGNCCVSGSGAIVTSTSTPRPTQTGGGDGTSGGTSTSTSGGGCSSESLQNCPGKSPGDSCGSGKTCKKADPGTGSDGKPICKCVLDGGGGTTGTTATTTPVPQCRNLKIYKGGAVVDPTTLTAGDQVVLAVKGTGATKGKIRVNGGTYTEDASKDANDEFTVDFTIPSGVTNFTIEGEVYINGAWR